MSVSMIKAPTVTVAQRRLVRHGAIGDAYRLIAVQALIGLVCVLGWAIFAGWSVALSTLLGVAIAVTANVYFARKVLAFSASAHLVKRAVRTFYQAQAMKMAITVVMFTLCFCFVPVHGAAFFAGYLLVQLGVWLSPLFLR